GAKSSSQWARPDIRHAIGGSNDGAARQWVAVLLKCQRVRAEVVVRLLLGRSWIDGWIPCDTKNVRGCANVVLEMEISAPTDSTDRNVVGDGGLMVDPDDDLVYASKITGRKWSRRQQVISYFQQDHETPVEWIAIPKRNGFDFRYRVRNAQEDAIVGGPE